MAIRNSSFRLEKKELTLHIANHVWAWLCLWSSPVSACCPTHLGPTQSGTRFASHTLSWEEAAQDTAHYDHPWEPHRHTCAHMSDMSIMCMIRYDATSIEISIPFNSQVCKNEHILTDTRRVSGWYLAVRGDRADGAISFYSLLTAIWPQCCSM